MRAGDPTLFGWIAVAAYMISAGFCLMAARSVPPDRRIWLALASALMLLAFNKQLDLQSVITQMARELAIAGGWYQHRRLAQFVFLACLAVTGAAVLTGLLIRMRSARPGLRLAVAGSACLILFVIGRAASFHHFDEVLGWDLGPLKFTVVPELIGSLLIAAGAVQAGRSGRDRGD